MVWIFTIFFIFTKKDQKVLISPNKKSVFVGNFYSLGSNYLPNFRKFCPTINKIICVGHTNEGTNKGESIGFLG